MSDSYQPIYDAIRSKIHNGDVGQAVESALINVPGDIARLAQNCFSEIACVLTSPSVVYKPRIFMDGDHWCALLGDDLQSGVAGFGKSPHEACSDFDRSWHRPLATSAKEPEMKDFPEAQAREAAEKYARRQYTGCGLDGDGWQEPIDDFIAGYRAAWERAQGEIKPATKDLLKDQAYLVNENYECRRLLGETQAKLKIATDALNLVLIDAIKCPDAKQYAMSQWGIQAVQEALAKIRGEK